MTVMINGVRCEELVNNYAEDVDLLHGPSARKGYLCDWNLRFQLARGLLGLAATTKIGGFITLQTPHPHPEMSTTYAHRIEIEGKGSPFQLGNNIAFPFAAVYCIYETLPWNFQPFDAPFQQIDPTHPFVYAEQRLKSGVEIYTIPGNGCKFATSGLACQSDATIRLALIEMEITIKQLPYMPTDVVLGQAGTLNNAKYLGVNTGCLIFNGVSTQTGAVSDGTYIQEASYSFTARSVRWDYAYDPSIWDYDQVLRGNGSSIFTLTDFSKIIPFYYQY